jgi:hypothetical protein
MAEAVSAAVPCGAVQPILVGKVVKLHMGDTIGANSRCLPTREGCLVSIRPVCTCPHRRNVSAARATEDVGLISTRHVTALK